jgi:prepilin-type N-terminal cleavage/methylation domain-containing protein/prepilin-type processing-associated H-X9-DG protein
MTRKHNKRKNAFTLIELLVSISIMSILISILLPAMSGSRKHAKRAQCLTRLRELYVAHAQYINTEDRFPDLNNLPDDGTWQFNYVIWDTEDFDNNFGPLVRPDIGVIQDLTILFCPMQRDPFHSFATIQNRWRPVRGLETRAGYGRRYNVSGESLSRMRTKALLADLIHFPEVVESAHKTGVNTAFTDGHAKWVKDPGKIADNDLTKPFEIRDNPIVKSIWKALDRSQ